MIVKSLMIEDKRVGEEAKVDHGVLFIRHLRNGITIYLDMVLFIWIFFEEQVESDYPQMSCLIKKKKSGF